MTHYKLRLFQKKMVGVFFASICLPIVANAQTLEQAVAYSLDNHPDIRVAYTLFKDTEKKVDRAEAGYFPTIDLTGGFGQEFTDSPGTRSSAPTTATLVRTELGVSLRQDLFSGFHTNNEVGRTSSDTSANQWRLHSEAEDVALEVSKVYVNVIKNAELIKLSEKNLAAHQTIYNQIKLSKESGLVGSADLSQIIGRLAKAQSNLIAVKNNYLDSKVTFYRIIAQRPNDLIIPYPDSSLLPKSKGEGLIAALKNNAVIKAVANDVNAAHYQYKSAQATYYPKVSLVIEANYDDNLDGVDSSNGGTDGESNEVLAMVRFSYNIFSGGKDTASAKEAAYKVSEAKDLNRSAHREVEESFLLSWNAFELLNLQKKYIKKEVIAANETQLDYQQQFSIGQRSLLDLLDTQNELYLTRIDFLEAEMAEITAQYRILHAIGLLVDSFRVTRPPSWQGERQFAGGVTR
jgi:adhesin transport system outer membrane protein